MTLTLGSKLLVGAMLIIGSPVAAVAQTGGVEDQIKKLQDAVAAAQGSADRAHRQAAPP